MSQDKVMKMFAADGRIYQIEYAFKAAQGFGQTSIAIRGKDSVVVCTEKKVPDSMIVADSVSHVFNIADDIGAVIVGNMNDARYVVSMLRMLASQFKFKFAYEIPVQVLASHLAAHMQKYSQYQGVRSMCVIVTLVGCDVEKGPQVYKIDPSG
jgi:20S proteasome subunit alpha 1